MATKKNRPPRVFISYSHAPGPVHEKTVLELSQWLRKQKIDSWIDQYVAFPPQGWPDWCIEQLEAADYVLAVCEPKYCESFERRQSLDIGHGVAWEGRLITDWLYDHIVAGQSKVIPVVLRAEDRPTHIPRILKRYTTFNVGTMEGKGKLVDYLTDRPSIVPVVLEEILTPVEDVPVKNWKASKGAGLGPREMLAHFPSGTRIRARMSGCKLYAEKIKKYVLIEQGCTGTAYLYEESGVPSWSVDWDAHAWLDEDAKPVTMWRRRITTSRLDYLAMMWFEPI
ncbi:toll/interleukin-1 receptor domain-containing protein [Nonomuraea fuscirosea]|uniref:toll/interleukin-1 receptor domain-containing protein n=1 Tax=Nonomuraea fuscirosea TaxID=1291556 RepID=UPI003415AFCC